MITGWLLRLAVGIGLLAVVLFDVGAVVVAHLSAMDDSSNAAIAASTAFSESTRHDPAEAAAAAEAFATDHHAQIVPGSIVVDTEGTVHLKLTHVARTIVIQHIGPLARFRQVTVAATYRLPQ